MNHGLVFCRRRWLLPGLELAWQRELEADQFEGMLVRELERNGGSYGITLQSALAWASLYPEVGSSHPPRAQRMAAILEGYRSGSPCLGRQVKATVGPPGVVGGVAGAASPSVWEHNGSRMYLVAEGASRKFYYQSPRAGLETVNIHPDTLLFEGRREGDRYVGTAYVFSATCGAASYRVSGNVSADQRQVTMRGRKPLKNAACADGRPRGPGR